MKLSDLDNISSRSKKKRKGTAIFLNLLIVIVVAFILQLFIRMILLYPITITDKSMMPNLDIGDSALVLYKQFATIKKNDIVLVAVPFSNREALCRLAAKSGDRVSVENKTIQVNDITIASKYLPPQSQKQNLSTSISHRDNSTPIQVKPNHFYCLFDNRSYTQDSRSWGAFPKKNILGKVIYKNWIFQSLD